MTSRTWARAVVVFFAWGFAMHAIGLLLHELGGHALASVIFGCGIRGYDLTYFGHGEVFFARCDRWTELGAIVTEWAGLAVAIAVGVAAAVFQRRAKDAATRLLVGLVAFFFLLGQLGYATSGGFHDLYDPAHTARLLGAHGVHWLAWVPPFAGYAAAAFLVAPRTVDAFREVFGATTRLATLGRLAATLGLAGLLYWIAFRVEWAARLDMTVRGVGVEAQRRAAVAHQAPPFPIELVLLGVALASIVYALARRVRVRDAASIGAPFSERVLAVTAAAAFVSFAIVFVMML